MPTGSSAANQSTVVLLIESTIVGEPLVSFALYSINGATNTFYSMVNSSVTSLLEQGRAGDQQAMDQVVLLLYNELRAMARGHMQRENAGHTLQATAVVHEAYARIAGGELDFNDRAHFLATMATVMRRVLVDHARANRRAKRGAGAAHVSLDAVPTLEHPEGGAGSIADIDEAIRALGEQDPRKEKILELHYFGGLTHPEIAEALDISPATVDRDLRFSRAWLKQQLRHD